MINRSSSDDRFEYSLKLKKSLGANHHDFSTTISPPRSLYHNFYTEVRPAISSDTRHRTVSNLTSSGREEVFDRSASCAGSISSKGSI